MFRFASDYSNRFKPLLLWILFPAGLICGAFAGYFISQRHGVDSLGHIHSLRQVLATYQRSLDGVRHESLAYQSVVRQRVSDIEARMVSLDASNEQLLSKMGVKHEKVIGSGSTTNNPLALVGQMDLQSNNLSEKLDALEEGLLLRAVQVRALEGMVNHKTIYISRQLFGDGWPIQGGWISSGYGSRVDPFTGQVAWHHGVDFAGEAGSDIRAVASGIITWASSKRGYGPTVEIDHGNNLSTRYGHNQTLLVKPGDVVKKGQIIATLGKGGRATGYHVHFEVRLDGLPVNPSSYFSNLHLARNRSAK